MSGDADGVLLVRFCGEEYPVRDGEEFVIGRGGDLHIDDNPWLHRRFLVIYRREGLWWLANEGDLLAATVSHSELLHTWMGPGARLPLVLDAMTVRFTAGPTTYDFDVVVPSPAFEPRPAELTAEPAAEPGPHGRVDDGSTTRRPPSLTVSQRALIVGLAEPVLRGDEGVGTTLPSNAQVAERLGWSITRFNRKLDNVCARLADAGVRGLRGEQSRLASQRRARLVEYALAARIVTAEDLRLIEVPDAS